MADFTVNRSDGTVLAVVTDGTVDSTSSSIGIVGRNIIDYGEIIAETQVHIMENFANSASPSFPTRGQLWWDTSIDVLNVYDGSSFLGLALASDLTSGLNDKIDIAGDTMTGLLTLSGAPVNTLHAATKDYVDTEIFSVSAGTLSNLIEDTTPQLGGQLDAQNFKIVNVGEPTLNSDAATKSYVDAVATGLDFKESIHMASIANLPSTYNNGTAGLGATLTATSTGVLPPSLTDNHAHYVIGTRLLVKDQTDPVENGLYTLTTLGAGEEVTEITTIADVAGNLNSQYFTGNDNAGDYYVWYNVNAAGVDPTPGGTGIEVAVATNATAEDVKDATIAAINGGVPAITAFNDEENIFFIVNDATGIATDTVDGAATTGFSFTTIIDGTASPVAWILTRATDADNSPTNEVSGGMFAFIEDGATLANSGWVMSEPTGLAVIGTDDLVFTQFSGGGGLVDAATLDGLDSSDFLQVALSQTYTKQKYFSADTLVDGAAISWNLDDSQVASVTLGGSRTLSSPTNMKDGGTYVLIVKQDGTGSRALAYGGAYKWPNGVVPTLSSAPNTVDIITFISDGTSMYGVAQFNFS